MNSTQVYQSMSSQTVCLIDGWMSALKELIISLIHLVNCLLLSTLRNAHKSARTYLQIPLWQLGCRYVLAETVKCNQHKVFLFWKCPCRDRCDRNPTYIFRYLNPIPTKGADSANHCRGSTKKFSSRYIRYTCQNVYGAKISMPKCLLPKC